MRVGFDARWCNRTGVGNYVTHLLQAMADLPDEVEIVAYEDPWNRLEGAESRRIRKIPVRAGKYSFREQFELARRCRTDRLDVFHSPFYIAPWLAPCPVVVTIHDLIPFLFKIYSPAKQKLIQLGYRLAVKKATRLIADSERTRDDLQAILRVPSNKITVVHLATSREHFHPQQGVSEAVDLCARYGIRQPYVLTMSAKNWRTKNLPVVLEALSICRQQVRFPFQVVVVGSPEGFRAALQQDAIALDNVVLTGFLPTPDLAKLYRCAQVFVTASNYEGFGLPLLEAMSCGCAVVSSNGGSLAEVAGPGAILVDPDAPVWMGRAVARLLDDAVERRKQQERSKRRAADFSWESTARQTLAVYREAAKMPAPRETVTAPFPL